MSNEPVSGIKLSQIIERKLSFLLSNEISPWDGDNYDLGERDALQKMLSDSAQMSEKEFEEKYLAEVNRLKKRIEGKDFSEKDNDDYYESFSNTLVSILALITPANLYDLEDE
ncbi:hypothetical protein [Vibrio caribbeanicus]|uniref:Uncharacterized protein n=1 Tax=Vibrio caribbeanicus ATCC BAA-2122 TaxID=796620 RepID=E3BNH5_9VIBR|nr:hypothetical protein [Vibrio caribbeanicus]EFP95394.1 hypothetical protein VIBC2010_15204 [Vibrio caribbeanicus ATCC BAA-2122]